MEQVGDFMEHVGDLMELVANLIEKVGNPMGQDGIFVVHEFKMEDCD